MDFLKDYYDSNWKQRPENIKTKNRMLKKVN